MAIDVDPAASPSPDVRSPRRRRGGRLGIVLALAAAGTAGAAGATLIHESQDSSTGKVTTDLEALHVAAVKGCAEYANDSYDKQYPPVTVTKEPTAEELQAALDKVTARETEGEGFRLGEYATCMEISFDAPARELIGMPAPDSVLSGAVATSVPTSETGTEG